MNAHLHTPDDPRVFVFGSNLMGIHGAGAAKYAHQKLGAEWGVNQGRMPRNYGRCYALPTCRVPGEPLKLHGGGRTIEHYVDRFLTHACEHPRDRFFISAIGCGFAGYTEAEIAPLFRDAPANCDLPPGWRA